MKMSGFVFSGMASAAIMNLAAAGVALATPGSGVVGTISGRGTAVEKVKTRGDEPYDVVVQTITIAPRTADTPGGHTGWHTHPGIAVAVVASGTLTIYDAEDPSCSPQTYETGDVYVDPGYGHVHLGRNEGYAPAVVLVTYLDVPVGVPDTGVRINADDPGNCSF